LNLRKRIHLT